MRWRSLSFLVFYISTISLYAQETFLKDGISDDRDGSYGFVNATIFQSSRTKIENGTLLIQKGKIVNVGTNITIPKGYTIIDLSGQTIYPSFIDIHTSYGLPEVAKPKSVDGDQITPETSGPYNANDAIKAHYNAVEQFEINKKDAKPLRKLGFGTVLTFRDDGIARGTSALVSLDETTPNEVVLKGKAAAHFSFSRGSSTQHYPVSLMGSNALLRQTHYDAEWYGKQKTVDFHDEALEAYLSAAQLPQIFSVSDLNGVLRADAVGDEIGKQYIIQASGEEYQKINEIRAMNAPMIISVNFPKAPKITDPFEALDVSLEKLKHWEMAPTNPGVLEKSNIRFAFSTTELDDKSEFLANIKRAIKNGLSEEAALRALTETPALLIKADDQVGQLFPGMLANFIITTNGIFTDSATINENWVQGHRFIIKEKDDGDYAGIYELNLMDMVYQLEASGKIGKQKWMLVEDDTTRKKLDVGVEEGIISLTIPLDTLKNVARLLGWVKEKDFEGNGQLNDGSWIHWTAQYKGPVPKDTTGVDSPIVDESPGKQEPGEMGKMIYPFVAYGRETLPQQETIIIKNATIWTNEDSGIIEDTDILIKNGKIDKVGDNLSESGARIIEGTGKHLTPGIIDEHSHIALSSVNDIAVNSSMVRMKDVVDPSHINIYRQLSGGVTTSQLLHGSANPIGGQSAIIKLRWGRSASELLIEGADKYIKFALGENPTRARNDNSTRYPQTRMGMEQVYIDCFNRAQEYKEAWDTYNNLPAREKANTTPPRRELDLEPLVEILNDERFITCHSYVQSEINMLMKVAEKFDFKVNTFTHILEGYKVADKMKAHGVGGSTFSDWYNYKMEVLDAIPYNAAIMNSVGVVTAVNSDDAEMARRLNQEAAKSVKYGGTKEEEALKMVTLNPAKLLHLDDRIGSIEPGKDADVVLWNDHPLSIYSRPDYTIIDGTVYFDYEEDQKMQKWVEAERARLIQKVKKAADNGEKTEAAGPTAERELHCEDITIDNY